MTDPSRVQVLILRCDPDLPMPCYAHPGDAGADLYARGDVVLAPGQRALVPTGVAIALPAGYAAFVHPRSGLAASHGITVLNAPGTVDAGYRGEILVNLLNTDTDEAFTVSRGDRIAQLVVQRVSEALFVEVGSLPGSHRGDNGHGASGGFGTPSHVDDDPMTSTPGSSTSGSSTPGASTPGASTTGSSTTVTPTSVTPTTTKD